MKKIEKAEKLYQDFLDLIDKHIQIETGKMYGWYTKSEYDTLCDQLVLKFKYYTENSNFKVVLEKLDKTLQNYSFILQHSDFGFIDVLREKYNIAKLFGEKKIDKFNKILKKELKKVVYSENESEYVHIKPQQLPYISLSNDDKDEERINSLLFYRHKFSKNIKLSVCGDSEKNTSKSEYVLDGVKFLESVNPYDEYKFSVINSYNGFRNFKTFNDANKHYLETIKDLKLENKTYLTNRYLEYIENSNNVVFYNENEYVHKAVSDVVLWKTNYGKATVMFCTLEKPTEKEYIHNMNSILLFIHDRNEWEIK